MPKKVIINEKETCSTSDLAYALGVTNRRICQLAGQGIIKRAGRNEFYKYLSIKGYIAYLNTLNNSAVRQFKDERTATLHIKSEIAKIDLNQLKRSLIPAEEVKIFMNGTKEFVIKKTSALPSELAPLILGQNNINEVQKILDNAIEKLLIELSNFDPAQLFDGIEESERM